MAALKGHLATLDTPDDPKLLEEANAAVKLAEDNVKKLEAAEAANLVLLAEKETVDGRVKALEESSRIAHRDEFLAGAIRKGKMRPADLKRLEELHDVAPDKTEAMLNDGPVVVDIIEPEGGTDSINTPDDEDDADLQAAKALSEKENISVDEAYGRIITTSEVGE